ncbi:MAG: sugar transferase [Trueperaceae bacterium]|nr:sugar transferase [Trueperaceae bacterium]MCW5818340.1 sugar transferase [Trueperaceae bacterium]
MARRVFDTAVAGLGLVISSPVLLVAAVAIRLDSPGPVIFRQKRVGLNGAPFEILKFRTMRVDAERVGAQLTVGADPRITKVGAFLRAWKIDELPQLANVVKGEMALVGPRPEVPRYVELYTPEQRRVLSVRPGITDPASIEFRNESELMAEQPDPELYYREVIMPRKVQLNLDYLARRSLGTDLGILFATAKAVLLGRGGEGA